MAAKLQSGNLIDITVFVDYPLKKSALNSLNALKPVNTDMTKTRKSIAPLRVLLRRPCAVVKLSVKDKRMFTSTCRLIKAYLFAGNYSSQILSFRANVVTDINL